MMLWGGAHGRVSLQDRLYRYTPTHRVQQAMIVMFMLQSFIVDPQC